MKVPFLDLKTQYNSIKDKINKEINWVLDNTSFILGDKVKEFEKNFASYCNKKYAIAVNSGTSALHLALLAHGIKQEDEVITVPNTFIATAEAISYTGAKPVFVDINKETFNIDVSKIEQAITKKTKAIVPVHLYGQSADMNPIIEIAKKHNLILIEDCAQAHGVEYKGKRVPVSDTGCFSFYPGKNLGAYGEGGAVLTDDGEIAEKIKILRDHGQKEKHHHKYIGYNYRMDGFQGAVLNVKLRYLDEWIKKRREKAKLYNQLLSGVVETPREADYTNHIYHLYVIKIKEREKLAEYLKSKEIDTGMHYPIPIPLQEAYSYLGYKLGDFPITEQVVNEILSLPIYPELTEEQITYVVEKIKEFKSNNQ
ncbi:MAG TPA: DegT/DnrJ/EryC1/StrS family aminotransferase [Candidatus Paceibacterota bacterium]|nr:DegT/DnrJ/EryC1/StrS family aminotransferase [Candidatus Paceibacterota bacterium]